MSKSSLRICENGHKFYKSSDSPVCPICERNKKPASGFLSKLGAPARRALEREGLDTLIKLSKISEKDLLQLHGVGPSTLPKLRESLKEKGFSFKKN